MASDKSCTAGAAAASVQAAGACLRAAASASHAATRSWAREQELQRGHTAELAAGARQRARDIAASLGRAERLADATMRPLRVWDEVACIVGTDASSAAPDASDGLVWVLEEAAGICEMFLQDAAADNQNGSDVVARIDAVLEALGEEEK